MLRAKMELSKMSNIYSVSSFKESSRIDGFRYILTDINLNFFIIHSFWSMGSRQERGFFSPLMRSSQGLKSD